MDFSAPDHEDTQSGPHRCEEKDSSVQERHHRTNLKRTAKKQPSNPLQRGIIEYLTEHLPEKFYTDHSLTLAALTSSLPKRFTTYPPLLLLPANSFDATPPWRDFISSLNHDQLQSLYKCIAASFSVYGVTHIALNAPIARVTVSGEENKMRSPTGFVPLYGDFGPFPATTLTEGGGPDKQTLYNPTETDFRAALWVRAVQNSGITQIWAPAYTMFSRGNIREKARILGLGSGKFEGLAKGELGQPLRDIAVVDMYAGIGYFVFSYLRRGVGRVWAWEINPWSVEGLRRGCEENGWGILVVKVDYNGQVEGGIHRLMHQLNENHRVVAFLSDNSFAVNVLAELKRELKRQGSWKPIRHVNLGLLPSSRQSWDGALRVLDAKAKGWIHVHENVDAGSIDAMKADIEHQFQSLLRSHKMIPQEAGTTDAVACTHVEKVKTYAPGVVHCVFDMCIERTPSTQ
ncbi:hypothetical protein VTO42DRAFT_8977 [Malbranchea cinnamomea]